MIEVEGSGVREQSGGESEGRIGSSEEGVLEPFERNDCIIIIERV